MGCPSVLCSLPVLSTLDRQRERQHRQTDSTDRYTARHSFLFTASSLGVVSLPHTARLSSRHALLHDLLVGSGSFLSLFLPLSLSSSPVVSNTTTGGAYRNSLLDDDQTGAVLFACHART